MTNNTPTATPSGEGTLLIFGGTTEGRIAVDVCEQAGKTFYYSTKGNSQDVEMHHGKRLTGAMSADEMTAFCTAHNIGCIIDAAHPFAECLHREIAAVGIPVIRLERQTSALTANITYCDGYDDAVRRMQAEGIDRLIAFSGANTISKLKPFWQHHHTVFRILDREESIAIARQNGFPTEHLIYYSDTHALPTADEEMATLQSVVETFPAGGKTAFFTKQSGSSGGYEAKVEAALRLGLNVFVIKAPRLPYHWTFVSGRHTLRRAIEQTMPSFFPLKTGLTTGACATAAAKAALMSLLYGDCPEDMHFALPDGEIMSIPVIQAEHGTATVVKPSNDDPDVTRGCHITATVSLDDSGEITFAQGEGVGRVTLPGLGIPVGGPAINPTPRRMMTAELRAVISQHYAASADRVGAKVTISVADGTELAKRTFNYKVGVVGGISIIGTSGIVHPLSNEAFMLSIRRELEVAKAVGCTTIGLVSGMKSERALRAAADASAGCVRYVHYGNFIGHALSLCHELGFARVVVGIMIGKAVKLAAGNLDTHSHKVLLDRGFLCSLAPEYADRISQITMARELWDFMPPSFFDIIRQKCLEHCATVFPNGEIEIQLIDNNTQYS